MKDKFVAEAVNILENEIIGVTFIMENENVFISDFKIFKYINNDLWIFKNCRGINLDSGRYFFILKIYVYSTEIL